MVSDGCLDGIWRESGRCLRAVWKVSVTGQVRADQLILDRSKWDRSTWDRPSWDRSIWDRSSQDRSSQN